MNELERFLNPARGENLRFVLSEAFTGEDGRPLVWEMRQLSAAEGLELERQYAAKGETELLLAMTAASLVTPNLRDERLLSALSKKSGGAVLSPAQALKAMLTMPELIRLVKIYYRCGGLDETADSLIEKAKNL